MMKEVRLELKTDSTGARAIGARQGVGRIKHLEVGSLWLQSKIRKKEFIMSKVGTDDNTPQQSSRSC